MAYRIVWAGLSRSFPSEHPFIERATEDRGSGVFILGSDAGAAYRAFEESAELPFIAVELASECLGDHTGENMGKEGANVVGFARFRLGDAEPSNLIELVKQPATLHESITLARRSFESAGLTVALCNDFPGRIVDRLVRPYFNAVLRRLDEGLASAADMDTTLRLGLGYPEGPVSLLTRTGLARHYDVSQALYEALGSQGYLPARRAQVAKHRGRERT